ncbi:MAG: thiamine pyrophosphate-dependent enzyme [Actinomycetota bacterium]|nr:thiamine pyrophosphate-dependent enzyme [Actinomycetota bacterium]
MAPGSTLTASGLLTIFDAQLASRHLDHAARWLRAQSLGFYTIGSAGHEGNALVAAALRPTDPALLHYRSGGFYLARAQQIPGHDGVADVLLGLLTAADEPIAGGRHKVFGHAGLAVIPQTSTIASHLPRALGVAFAIGRAGRLGVPTAWPADALAVCSFGDASLNHSTAQGALNAAGYTAHQGMRVPLLFVCEDNGWGISVPTPSGWVESSLRARAGLRYEQANSTDPVAVYDTVEDLAEWIRSTGRPAVLHLRTVRFGGHAGTDVEASYRAAAGVRADRQRDPLLATARTLVTAGFVDPCALVARYLESRATLRAQAVTMIGGPRLASAAEVIAPLSPRHPVAIADRAVLAAGTDARSAFFRGRLPEAEGSLTLAETINRALGDALAADRRVLVFGEDVGVKGGVYGVTRGLQRKAGAGRVFDTLLDEQSILGLGLGTGVSGLVPIPEIQYLAYLHNAEDQLRGEAASLSFFSNGQYRNPMVVRIAGYGYQRGFGGHFHYDNGVAVLRDIPGLVVASPAHPRDAASMLRTCIGAAAANGVVSVFLEPIALYHTRDLHLSGDERWTAPYTGPDSWAAQHVPIGEPAVAREGDDVLVVSWANGLYMSLRVAERLAAEGISCRVLDLRWLAPLPAAIIADHARALGRVVVVDETRRSGGVGEAILSGLVEHGVHVPTVRVAAHDSFIPLGDAARLVLVSEDDIAAAIRSITT